MANDSASTPLGFPPPPPPPKPGVSGCAIALIVFAVLVVLGVGAVVAAGVWFSRTDEGKAALAAVDVAMQSSKGAGPDALRAAGCKEAAAIRFQKMNEAVKPLIVDAGTADTAFNELDEVHCMNPTKAMTCDDVARIFAAAEQPKSGFVAVVSASSQDRCRATYKADGVTKEAEPEAADAGAPAR